MGDVFGEKNPFKSHHDAMKTIIIPEKPIVISL